jgi:apolipoprotein N-acyltransferase
MAEAPPGTSDRPGKSKRSGLLLPLAGGCILATGHPPFSLPWLALVGLILGISGILNASDARQSFWRGWTFGTAYFATTLHWIVEPFLVDPVRHGWMAPFALVLLSGGLALFWGTASALSSLFFRSRLVRALGWAAILTLMEFVRSFIFTGFPWALIGTIWVETPIAQTVAYIGPHSLGLLTLVSAAAFAGLLFDRPALASVSLALPLVALLGIGLVRDQLEQQDTDLTVRLIQPNAAQHLKWQPDMIPVFFQRQIDLTTEEPQADLVIWPETAIPYLLSQSHLELKAISTASRGAPVILGVRRRTNEGPKNALVVVGPAAEPAAIYDKAHLVPFGEYMPFGELAARLGIRGMAAGDGGGYAPGPEPVLLNLGKYGTVLPLICYEAIFPHLGRALSQDADWIVQITNDAWFGEFAGPQQHLALAQMRAIERGLPLVRAANTGISAVIDPFGRLTEQLPLGVQGRIDSNIPRRLPPTLYVKNGEAVLIVLLVLLFATAFLMNRERN